MSKRSPDREADVGAPSAKRQELDPSVIAKINELYASGVCAQGDVDTRAMEHLKGFPSTTAIEILDQFQNTDLTNVRNRSAYLSGVMGRFRKYNDPDGGPPSQQPGGGGGGGTGGGGGGPPPPGAPRALPRMMQRMLDEIYERRSLSAGTLDQRCLNALGQLPVAAAEASLDQLDKQDLGQIRNIPAWFMSVIKRHNPNPQQPHHQGGGGHHMGPVPPMGPPPPGGPPPGGMMPRGNGMGMPPGGPGMPMNFEPPPRPPPPQQRGPYGGRGDHMPPGDFGMPGMMPGMQGPGFNNMMPPGMNPGMRPGMPPMGMGMPPPGPSNDRSMDQIALGVRVDEFHNLSMHAPMVQAAPALKLQQLWDDGCRLVSLLDDRAWEALAALGAPEALVVIDEVADNMIRNADNIRNINAVFMSIANKYLRPGGEPAGGGGPPGRGPGGPDGRGGGGGPRDVPRVRNDGPGDLSIVSPAIRQRIEALVTSHGRYVTRAHFDSGIINALNQIGDEGSLKVLDEIAQNDLSNVRNPPGYMMGIISRYLRGDRQPR